MVLQRWLYNLTNLKTVALLKLLSEKDAEEIQEEHQQAIEEHEQAVALFSHDLQDPDKQIQAINYEFTRQNSIKR